MLAADAGVDQVPIMLTSSASTAAMSYLVAFTKRATSCSAEMVELPVAVSWPTRQRAKREEGPTNQTKHARV